MNTAEPSAEEQRDPRAQRRHLRAAYTQASDVAEKVAAAYYDLLGKRSSRKAERDRVKFTMNSVEFAERQAGRAYLRALDANDPACVSCGCSELDPCTPDCRRPDVTLRRCVACLRAEIGG